MNSARRLLRENAARGGALGHVSVAQLSWGDGADGTGADADADGLPRVESARDVLLGAAGDHHAGTHAPYLAGRA